MGWGRNAEDNLRVCTALASVCQVRRASSCHVNPLKEAFLRVDSLRDRK
jgi:hypothetical protein